MRFFYKLLSLLILGLFFWNNSYGQFYVEKIDYKSALETYILDTLFGGGGEIWGITYNAVDTMEVEDILLGGIGRFKGGLPNTIGFTEGLILSNGDVMVVDFKNGNSTGAATFIPGDRLPLKPGSGGGGIGGGEDVPYSDRDMNLLMSALINDTKEDTTALDARVISFYFKPYDSVVKIRYVFTSEEYLLDPNPGSEPDIYTVDSAQSDVMGIYMRKNPFAQSYSDGLISTKGNPNQGVPTLPVCIKYCNDQAPYDQDYRRNPPPPGLGSVDIQYDGLSDVLTAVAVVNPCENYFVKIAVADHLIPGIIPGIEEPYDLLFNSAIMLEAGGFTSGSGTSNFGLEWLITDTTDNPEFAAHELVEGPAAGACANKIIQVSKNNVTIDTVYIRFKIIGASEDEWVLTPPPYQDSLLVLWPQTMDTTYILTALNDGVAEPTPWGHEKWEFRYQMNPCDIPMGGGIGTPSAGYSGYLDTIYVYDRAPLINRSKTYGHIPTDIYFCGNDVIVDTFGLTSGGIPPYYTSWTHPPNPLQLNTESYTVTIVDSPDTANVRISDRCSNFPGYEASVNHVIIYTSLVVEGPLDFQLCENLVWPISIISTNVDDDFTVEWYFQGNLVGSDKIYVVTWDEYGSLIQTADSISFQYVVSDFCGNSTTGEVWAFLDPVVDISGDTLICLGESNTLSSTPGKSYQWFNNSVSPGNEIPGAINQTYTFTPPAEGYYTVCVEIINACDEPASTCFEFYVSELTVELQLNGGTNFQVCPNTEFILEEINGYTGWHWMWEDEGQSYTMNDVNTVSISLLEPGTHIITVSAYNEYGCYDEDEFEIEVFPYTELEAFTELDPVCAGFPTRLFTESSITVTDDNFYWTSFPDDPSLVGQENEPEPVVMPSDPTTYTCYTTDINGCADSSEVFVDIRPPVIGDMLSDPPASCCTGETVTIEFLGDESQNPQYSWTFDDGVPATANTRLANVVWNTASVKNIHLTITETNCVTEFDFTYTVHPMPEASFTWDKDAGCSPVIVQFSDQSQNLEPPVDYLWDFGDGTTSTLPSPEHTFIDPGKYDVTLKVTNSTGCENELKLNDIIEVYPQPIADFDADPTAATINNPEISFTELVEEEYTVIGWDFGDGSTSSEDNPVYAYTEPGDFTVVMYIENEYGCADTASMMISITENVKVFFPTAFSPNGDGLNDCFSMSGTTNDIIDKFGMRVFYRWGDVVFETTVKNPDCVWDGKDLNGNLVPADTYVYHIYGTDYKGNKFDFKGVVMVVL